MPVNLCSGIKTEWFLVRTRQVFNINEVNNLMNLRHEACTVQCYDVFKHRCTVYASTLGHDSWIFRARGESFDRNDSWWYDTARQCRPCALRFAACCSIQRCAPHGLTASFPCKMSNSKRKSGTILDFFGSNKVKQRLLLIKAAWWVKLVFIKSFALYNVTICYVLLTLYL